MKLDSNLWTLMRHFTPEEFDHPEKMSHAMLLRLERVRRYAKVPMKVTSDYRDPKDDDDNSAHTRGLAVDIACTTSRDRFAIVNAALAVGIKRIGVYDRHIHLDVDDSLPQGVMWWGTSS